MMGLKRNSDARRAPADFGQSETIPLIEEQLKVDKKIVETGSVHILKEVEQKEVLIDTSVAEDELEVKRIRLNRPLKGAPPPIRYEGDTMIISVVQEELVLQRRLVLTEEVHITKRKVERNISHPVTIRKEKVSFKQDADAGANPRKGLK